MKTNLTENNFSVAEKTDAAMVKKVRPVRPNIDHLIKRILVERRKQEKKHFLVFTVILSTFVLIAFYIYS